MDLPIIPILLHEGEPGEKRVLFTKRNLLEYDITEIVRDPSSEGTLKGGITSWIKGNCLLHSKGHADALISYFIFPLLLKEMHQRNILKDCPEELKSIFEASFQAGEIQNASTGDPGYLLLFWRN